MDEQIRELRKQARRDADEMPDPKEPKTTMFAKYAVYISLMAGAATVYASIKFLG